MGADGPLLASAAPARHGRRGRGECGRPHLTPQPFRACADLAPGSLVANLAFRGLSQPAETLRLAKPGHFRLDRASLIVHTPLADLVGTSERLEVLAIRPRERKERVLVVYVEVTEP